MAHTPGPFDYYVDRYGISGPGIIASAEAPAAHSRALHALSVELEGDEKSVVAALEGDIVHATAANPQAAKNGARTLAAKGAYASGLIRLFGAFVETFDGAVETINAEFESEMHPEVLGIPIPEAVLGDPAVRRQQLLAELTPHYRSAEGLLDDNADTIATRFRQGPTDDNVRELVRAGLIPLASADLYPSLKLSAEDKEMAYLAATHIGFDIGPPSSPDITWDDDFVYDSDDPDASDYTSKLEWLAKLRAGEFVPGLDDATQFYRHYWDNNGDDLDFDYEEAYREDGGVRASIDDAIRRAQEGAEYYATRGLHDFSITGSAHGNSQYPTTENWQKTIGGHQIWSSADVQVDGGRATMTVTVHGEDYYNFNRGQQDIASGAPDDENGRFTELGWAKPFHSHGEVTRTVTWDLGDSAYDTTDSGDPERNPGREDREDERDSGDPDRTSRPDDDRDTGGWRGK